MQESIELVQVVAFVEQVPALEGGVRNAQTVRQVLIVPVTMKSIPVTRVKPHTAQATDDW
jgi:hypothetical protein